MADRWMIFDNTNIKPNFVAQKKGSVIRIEQSEILNQIMDYDQR